MAQPARLRGQCHMPSAKRSERASSSVINEVARSEVDVGGAAARERPAPRQLFIGSMQRGRIRCRWKLARRPRRIRRLAVAAVLALQRIDHRVLITPGPAFDQHLIVLHGDPERGMMVVVRRATAEPAGPLRRPPSAWAMSAARTHERRAKTVALALTAAPARAPASARACFGQAPFSSRARASRCSSLTGSIGRPSRSKRMARSAMSASR